MDKAEIKKQLSMSYSELVDYLLNKYGPAPCDYFVNESCKTKDRRIGRTKEGLECHHIDEDKAIQLSVSHYALKNPFDYQKKDRLVYANKLEHLILHIKIVLEPRNMLANELELPGLGGIINFMCPEINDFYDGYEFKLQYKKDLFAPIKDNFDDYIAILKYFLEMVVIDPALTIYVTPERLARDSFRKPVKKVLDALYE